jgi:3-methylfumaryl-CoA hydratase
MFAGGELEFSAEALCVGDEVTVETEIGQITQKSGRSGDFTLATFTTVVRTLSGEIALAERQDVVYTDSRPSELAAPEGALPIVGRPLLPRPDGGLDLVTDPTVLLRFSGLSANAHRIHYDLAYARETEGLPGLLVHGPLINLALAGLAVTTRTGGAVRRIRHRNLSPLFVGQPAVLRATSTAPDEVTAEATSTDGRTTSRVVVEFAVEESS